MDQKEIKIEKTKTQQQWSQEVVEEIGKGFGINCVFVCKFGYPMFLTSFINDAMTDQQYYYLTKETAMTTMTTTTTRHNTRMRKL